MTIPQAKLAPLRYEFLKDDQIYDVYNRMLFCDKWELTCINAHEFLKAGSKIYSHFIYIRPSYQQAANSFQVKLACLWIGVKYLNETNYGMTCGKIARFVTKRLGIETKAKDLCDLERLILQTIDHDLLRIIE